MSGRGTGSGYLGRSTSGSARAAGAGPTDRTGGSELTLRINFQESVARKKKRIKKKREDEMKAAECRSASDVFRLFTKPLFRSLAACVLNEVSRFNSGDFLVSFSKFC